MSDVNTVRAALEWYADKAKLAEHEKDIAGSGITALRQDAGERARAAATEIEHLFRSVPVSVGSIMPAGGGSREGEEPVADDFSARDWRRACVTLLQNLDALAKLTSTELIDEDAINVVYIRHMIEVTRDQHSLEMPQSFFRLDEGNGS